MVANLGRIDDLTLRKLDPRINGLNRALGRARNTSREVISETALSFGDVFALHGPWKALGRALRSGRRKIDVEALIRAMVFNRLCTPDSKLGCLRWRETVAMPAMPGTVPHQHLLRAMDALMDHAEIAAAGLFDGKLALLPDAPDLTAAEAARRDKALADPERGFRLLKSDIGIAPVHHRLPDRIRAHALVRFLALVLYRVMRMRL